MVNLDSTPAIRQYMALKNEGFAHRLNEDGIIDSICLSCFRTVVTTSDEVESSEHELKHHCDQLTRHNAGPGEDFERTDQA